MEARNGILLVPLTDETTSEAPSAESEEWQTPGAERLETFSYGQGMA